MRLSHLSLSGAVLVAALGLAACERPVAPQPGATDMGTLGGSQSALAPEASPQGELVGGAMGTHQDYLYEEFEDDDLVE